MQVEHNYSLALDRASALHLGSSKWGIWELFNGPEAQCRKFRIHRKADGSPVCRRVKGPGINWATYILRKVLVFCLMPPLLAFGGNSFIFLVCICTVPSTLGSSFITRPPWYNRKTNQSDDWYMSCSCLPFVVLILFLWLLSACAEIKKPLCFEDAVLSHCSSLMIPEGKLIEEIKPSFTCWGNTFA